MQHGNPQPLVRDQGPRAAVIQNSKQERYKGYESVPIAVHCSRWNGISRLSSQMPHVITIYGEDKIPCLHVRWKGRKVRVARLDQ